MVEGKCSREILACRCEINHSKSPKLRETWMCWEKPTVTAWPTSPAQEARAAAAGNSPGLTEHPLPTAHKEGGATVGWVLPHLINDKVPFHHSAPRSTSESLTLDQGILSHICTSPFSLSIPPPNSQSCWHPNAASTPQNTSPLNTHEPPYRLVLFQFGCRNCLEPLKLIQLCIHCISGL